MTTAELGLRERKRLATRRAIQHAALRLVESEGLMSATVEQISHAADVSPRTFFNYFSSKEEALLGDPPRRPSPDRSAWFSGGGTGDLFDDLSELLVDGWRDANLDLEVTALRQRVVKRHPELFGLRLITMRDFENDLAELVAARILHDRPELAGDPREAKRLGRLVTYVGIATVRGAWVSWTEEPGDDDPIAGVIELLHRSFDDLRSLLR